MELLLEALGGNVSITPGCILYAARYWTNGGYCKSHFYYYYIIRAMSWELPDDSFVCIISLILHFHSSALLYITAHSPEIQLILQSQVQSEGLKNSQFLCISLFQGKIRNTKQRREEKGEARIKTRAEETQSLRKKKQGKRNNFLPLWPTIWQEAP